ncbi:hypothetical protein LCGC14_2096430 [marine sediment metagenome]|uniref:Uncharacterized protein n=1 Tax=marine sediment metagenome TaxID=412755 RepID=A0A0F9EB95_9ZZZZ
MKIRVVAHKIRGIGLLLFFKRKYYALWFEWADGGQAMPDGTLKTLWIKPQIRFVHT